MAVDKAKAVNMPKDKIENAIKRASTSGKNLEEILYEGFGPHGIAVMVEVATDNRNRVAQELKSIFERGGGSLGGPGSVSFNFNPKGLLVVKKQGNLEEQMLKLIDIGVEDVEETESGLETYVAPDMLRETRKKLEADGFEILTMELIQKPNNFQTISDSAKAVRALTFLNNLEEHEDVQKVFMLLRELLRCRLLYWLTFGIHEQAKKIYFDLHCPFFRFYYRSIFVGAIQIHKHWWFGIVDFDFICLVSEGGDWV
jgi:YebC/PmpR family DNA-binding regulatory protein